ncbi:outer membrane beta-barrel family protein [Mucilaginibacter terrae]|nr:outer membrane beta-barrel family protein [Mucilaginibacter terrae]
MALLFSTLTYGQLVIKGTVLNNNGQPLPFTSIAVLKDSVKISGVFADQNGNFSANVPNNFPLQLSFKIIGYQVKQAVIDRPVDSLIRVVLMPNVKVLSEVVISGQKPLLERKIDRYVFNIENSIAAANVDAFDAVSLTPGVLADNNSIGLIGKGNARVMINDRLIQLSGNDLKDYLRSFNSSDIASIEVITSPPAKYDAAGSGGLINIKLKGIRKDSFSGSLSGRFNHGYYPGGNGTGTLNLNKRKWTVSNSLSLSNGSIKPIESNTFFLNSYQRDENQTRREFNKSISDRLSVDYDFSKTTNVGIEVFGSISHPDINGNDHLNFRSTAQALDSAISSVILAKHRTGFFSGNIHFNQVLDKKGRKLAFNADYFNNDANFRNSTHTVNQNYLTNTVATNVLLNTSDQTTRSYTGKLDIDYPTAFATLSGGSKYSFNNVNSYTSFQSDLGSVMNYTDRFQYDENIFALYANAKKKVSKKVEFQAGLRLEDTRTKVVSESIPSAIKNNYLNLFPSVYLNFTPNDNQGVSINYNRRISRPYFRSLNPFRFYSNEVTYSSGNPYLQPSIAQNFELNLTQSRNLYCSIYYSKADDSSKELTTVNEDGIQITTPLNYYTSNSYGAGVYYIYNQIKWWESSNAVNGFKYSVTSDIPQIAPSVSQTSFYMSSQNTFLLNQKSGLRVSVNARYSTPFVDGVYKYSSNFNLNLGIQTSLFAKKVTGRLIVNDLFRTQNNNYQANYSSGFYRSNNYYDRRNVALSLQYRFGNKKVSGKDIKNSNAAETQRL